mmetsp:Transcript_38987/g.59282  ORF Transcript_38987/g.59282 Transcript_38987/m.59282 type:complete len:92 (-) Transcript_38987:259-534(-)|eukprot:CAMPEP_0170478762 /NCGR_PEP_ID=MMETSP0208-20121228/228_1 /TAXON_ID=197538 /ORGANISM="Strombidium inclinatum, Strain S3" /LENGTH=91 /DNA_ID=CAMNT_0010751073 /DNA_START=1089 /DNA_END=1364 /DNA_ORIENTATION=+
MEPNYIKTEQSAEKSKMMAQKLEESPVDRHKAVHGEHNQANYLILAKEKSSGVKPGHQKQLFNDRTNGAKEEIREEEQASSKKVGSPIKAK